MKHYNSFGNINGKSYVVVNNETVVEVSEPFILMTEYSVVELLNKSIKELFSVLRVGPDFDVESIEGDRDYFLFTKSLGGQVCKYRYGGRGT